MTGSLRVGDDSWEIEAYGVRDKSWGPRTWQPRSRSSGQSQGAGQGSAGGPRPFTIWFSGNFGSDMAFGGAAGRRDGEMRGGGWIFRDARNLGLSDVTITSEYESGSLLHSAITIRGTDEEGKDHQFEGDLVTVTPTKIPTPGGVTLVNEGLARFRREDGAVGYGIAEYWHSVTRE
ncbi:MAG: hypothetical protein U5Q44_03650 [Dehalococcoidia bacterium]|nr:hypothetical protein [Dehalococcoidia bacterium]